MPVVERGVRGGSPGSDEFPPYGYGIAGSTDACQRQARDHDQAWWSAPRPRSTGRMLAHVVSPSCADRCPFGSDRLVASQCQPRICA